MHRQLQQSFKVQLLHTKKTYPNPQNRNYAFWFRLANILATLAKLPIFFPFFSHSKFILSKWETGKNHIINFCPSSNAIHTNRTHKPCCRTCVWLSMVLRVCECVIFLLVRAHYAQTGPTASHPDPGCNWLTDWTVLPHDWTLIIPGNTTPSGKSDTEGEGESQDFPKGIKYVFFFCFVLKRELNQRPLSWQILD